MKRIFVPLTPIVAVVIAAVAAFTILADEVPWNTYVVDRTVEVSPGARKNKAFPMEEGSAFCDKNDAFGKKKAILLLNGRKLEESDYEVFFPKTRQTTQEGRRGARIGFIIGKREACVVFRRIAYLTRKQNMAGHNQGRITLLELESMQQRLILGLKLIHQDSLPLVRLQRQVPGEESNV